MNHLGRQAQSLRTRIKEGKKTPNDLGNEMRTNSLQRAELYFPLLQSPQDQESRTTASTHNEGVVQREGAGLGSPRAVPGAQTFLGSFPLHRGVPHIFLPFSLSIYRAAASEPVFILSILEEQMNKT